MGSFVKDIRLGTRVLFHSPVFSLWVVLTLAFGIGANTAMFSVVDALVLHPVDYKNPEKLVMIWDRDSQGVQRRAAAANFVDWRAQTQSFSSIAGWAPASYIMTGLDQPQQVSGATVTANFFATLGVEPFLGRTFSAGEDGVENPGSAAHVAVISYRMWQDTFGGVREALGRKFQLDGDSYTIIGILPPDFQFFASRRVWVPVSINRNDRDYHYLMTVARLRDSKAHAAAEMASLGRALEQQNPNSNKGWTVEIQDLLEWVVDRNFRTRLLLLFGAVGMVLLIACANVAGLLLTRAVGRSHEMAVRLALGAQRTRLVRQLLTENLILAVLGAAAGLAVAWALIRVTPSMVPANLLPTAMPIGLNPLVGAFTLGLAVLTGIVFGLAPALEASRQHAANALKEGGRASTSGRGSQRFRQFMVALQVAVALILLVSAALMSQSLGNMTRANPGFDMKNLLAAPLFLPQAKYSTARAAAFHKELIEKLRALPQVQSVAAASNLPLFSLTMEVPFETEDAPPQVEAERPGVGYTTVSPDYFHALGIPIRSGRPFSDLDSATTPGVAVVNDAFVERYFPSQNPVGKRIQLNRPILGKNAFEPTLRLEIVGVVGNVRMGLEAPESKPILYAPEAQNVWTEYSWLAVRASGNPALLTGEMRRVILEMDSQQATGQISTLEERFANQFSQPKFQAALMSGFAALSLLLAVIGIYGVNSYAVAQRYSEIGLRMALGASPGAVMREVVARGVRLTAVGILAGLLGALGAASVLRSVLVGVSPTDPITLIVAAFVLIMVSLIACYLPARRAMRVDPSSALRQE